jgi:hypothetical protein
VQCEEFESRVNDLLDERRLLLADADLAAHASVCASCATIARGYDALVEGVAGWERVEPSADLTSRVLSQWELVKAQAAQSDSADWDSAELPALRPVGLQRMTTATPEEEGFWTVRRKRAFAGGTLAAAALATAAMLLIIGGVDRFRESNQDAANTIATPEVPGDEAVASSAVGISPATIAKSSVSEVQARQSAAAQFTLTSLPIVGQVTETYRPLLEETDRTVRKSFGLPATSGSGPTTGSALATTTTAQAEADDSAWDAYLPDQMAPVTQNAVRSVVALLRVLPGVDQPVHQ